MHIGVIKTSYKEGERRIPIYPEHLPWIEEAIRRQMVFEEGYGEDYYYDDGYFAEKSAGVASRDDIFGTCEIVIFPKPLVSDLLRMKKHQILWGWVHCVQQKAIAQAAIDRKLTLVAWEAMHHWGIAEEKLLHIFYKNNEIAGYAAVLHVLQLLGIDGHYGPRRNVAVIGFGSVSKGAIYALQGRGFNNIHVYTRRPVHLVADQNPDVYYNHIFKAPSGELFARMPSGDIVPLSDQLGQADIICNGTLQDTDDPFMFVKEDDVHKLKPRSVIIDISCDEGLGFCFAKPTTYNGPRNLDRVICYTWERKRGGPSGEFEEAASAVV